MTTTSHAGSTPAVFSPLRRRPLVGRSAALHLAARSHLPPPGTVLRREYEGRTIEVRVNADDSFTCEGRTYTSLSRAVEEATDTHWNGYRFFNLTQASPRRSSRARRRAS